MNEKVIEQLAEAFKHDSELVQDDLGAIEQAVGQKMQLLGQGLLQRLVNRQPNGYKGSSMACKCGGSMKFVQHRKRNIHTLFGQCVSDDTVKQVVHQVGSMLLQQQDQELNSFSTDKQIPQAQAEPEKLYVAVDGTTAHKEEVWHEVKIGCGMAGQRNC